jgi:hypothetical protein
MPILLQIGLVALVGAVVVGAALGVWRQWNEEPVERRWARRPRMSDKEFLSACGVPEAPFQKRVAIGARTSIASLAGVPRETILPEHSFANDLIELPYWDSLDWLGFIFEVEAHFRGAVVIPPDPIGDAFRAAGRADELRVKHVVRAVSAKAVRRKRQRADRAPGGWLTGRVASYCSRKRKEREQRTR